MATIDEQVAVLLEGLDLPPNATKEEVRAALHKELELTKKAEEDGKTESALFRATKQALVEEQEEAVNRGIRERDEEEVDRKVIKDYTEADKDAAIKHLAGLSQADIEGYVQKAMPRNVSTNFTVARRISAEGAEDTTPANMFDKLYLFSPPDGIHEHEQMTLWKYAMEDAYVVSVLTGRPVRETKVWKHYEGLHPDFMKAMATASGYEGEDWVPTGYSSEVIDLVRVPHALISKHPHVVMPAASYVMPTVGGDMTAYKAGERVLDDDIAFTASQMTTANKTLTAVTLAIRSVFSGTLEEDSIVPILPQMRGNMGFTIRTAMDQVMVNGDTTATHFDTGHTVSTADVRRLWTGYRETALTYNGTANVLDMTNNFNWDYIIQLQEKMAEYGAQGEGTLMFVTGYKGYRLLKGLKDDQNNNIMIGYGEARQSQDVPSLDAIEVVRTDKVAGDLNASGIFDDTTEEFTALLLVYKPAFVIGDRRALQLKLVDLPRTDQKELIGLMRLACTNVYAAAAEYTVAMGYDFT